MWHRADFFTEYQSISSLPKVDSIGFEVQEAPKTVAEKKRELLAHENNLPQAPKKKVPQYSTKYLVVFISKGILGAIEDKKYVYTFYNINLPVDIINHKSKKGDKLLPVGDYYVLRHEHRGEKMFMVLNYPNSKDGIRGYKQGLISEQEYKRIVNAEKNGVLPPFDTALGGPIIIRGDGRQGKKTAGNIAIPPDAMAKIWSFTPKGTPVRILP